MVLVVVVNIEPDDPPKPMEKDNNRGRSMFSHITLGVNDLEKSIAFYDEIMAILGHERHSSADTFAGYGDPADAETGVNSLWILVPAEGRPAHRQASARQNR